MFLVQRHPFVSVPIFWDNYPINMVVVRLGRVQDIVLDTGINERLCTAHASADCLRGQLAQPKFMGISRTRSVSQSDWSVEDTQWRDWRLRPPGRFFHEAEAECGADASP